MSALAGKRIAVTRAATQSHEIGATLSDLGACVVYVPLIEIAHLPDAIERLAAAFLAGITYDWIVITSANGARCVSEAHGFPTASKVAVIGPAVEPVIGRPADFRPSVPSAATLVAEFPHGVGRVLVVQGDLADTTVPNGLANKGWAIERVVAYSTRPRILSAEEAASIAECHAVTLYSPSAVHVLAAAKIALPPIIVTIGATTSAACIEYGWSPFESPATTNDAVAHRLTELLGELLTP